MNKPHCSSESDGGPRVSDSERVPYPKEDIRKARGGCLVACPHPTRLTKHSVCCFATKHSVIPILLLISNILFAVSGDGNVTKEKLAISDFRNLTVNGPFKLVFSNNSQSDYILKLETDKNLHQYISTTQIGNDVFVSLKPEAPVKKFTKLILYIDNRDIHSLSIKANTNEETDIPLMMGCENTHIKINGSIPISICEKEASQRAYGAVRNKHSRLLLEANNARSIKLKGHIDEADIINTGTGAVMAYELRADKIRVRNTNIAAVEVYSAVELKINNTGTGHVYYKGEGSLSELKEQLANSTCREEYLPDTKPLETTSTKPISAKSSLGFNADSLFEAMLERDQKPRKVKPGDTIHSTIEDTENFECLKWYFSHYGYPDVAAIYPATLIMHIDNYQRFMQLDKYLLQAVKEKKLQSNTYAYSYDRSLLAAGMRPRYFYFFRDSEWDIQNKLTKEETIEVNKHRQEIGLPEYPKLLNGKYF